MVRSLDVDFYYDKFALCLTSKIWFLAQIALDQMLFNYPNQCYTFCRNFAVSTMLTYSISQIPTYFSLDTFIFSKSRSFPFPLG